MIILIENGFGNHASYEKAQTEAIENNPSLRYIVCKKTKNISRRLGGAFNFEIHGFNELNELKEILERGDIGDIFDTHEKKHLSAKEIAERYVESLTPEQLHELTKKALVAHLTR
jgi:hypothetical protein